MSNLVDELEAHTPQHEYFIAIDSDGCVFDTMELKQKECFIPNIIKHWGLQSVSKYVREAAEFVNLYSYWRGQNRFPALVKVFDLCGEWDRIAERGVTMPDVPNLRRWIDEESKLSNSTLEAYCREHDASDMHKTLKWSLAVNETIEAIVQGGAPPFPHAEESLDKAGVKADLLVCSQTPCEALIREWETHGLKKYVFSIAGQEMGTKAEHLALASEGRYGAGKVLMVGDAIGDLRAAQSNNASFYPIFPGEEQESWERFYREALDRFFEGTYAGDYEESLLDGFMKHLPELPPWKG